MLCGIVSVVTDERLALGSAIICWRQGTSVFIISDRTNYSLVSTTIVPLFASLHFVVSPFLNMIVFNSLH